MKLCINCKHIFPSALGEYSDVARCSFERPISLVTGKYKADTTLPFAELERHHTGRCTPVGVNWEAADHVMTPEEEEELMKGNIV